MERLITLIKSYEKTKIKTYKKGEYIFITGDTAEWLIFLVKGEVESIKITASGKEQTINKIGENNFIGEAMFLGNKKYPVDILAREDCTTIQIKKPDFIEFIIKNDLLDLYFNNISNKIIHLSNIIEILSYDRIIERICAFIYKEHESKKCMEMNIPNKSNLGKKLSTSREVISRNFKQLIQENIIEEIGKNRIKIINIKGLENIIYK